MTSILIEGGRTLQERYFSDDSLLIEAGRIERIGLVAIAPRSGSTPAASWSCHHCYPAPILVTSHVAVDGILPLADAWSLISATPAQAAGLADRGMLAEGWRADIILVDDTTPMRPRVVAVFAGGHLVHLTEANRLVPQVLSRRKSGCR